MTRTYFGTDGIRGVAGRFPMRADFAFSLGAAAGERLKRSLGRAPTVTIGMDTRRSGPMLAHALVAGIASRGGHTVWLGVMPTPGVAHVTTALGADAGVVVSASHNPFEDNGIKFFGATGQKLADAEEAEIEAELDTPTDARPPVEGADIGGSRRYRRDEGLYRNFLLEHAPYLDGMRIGLDCAHGAASAIAPEVFRRIGSRLDVINAEPDGININVDCGSTHPATIRERVLAQGLEVGVTFDGDADRALLVDRRGRLVTGDHIMAIVASTRGDREIVGTVMSNLGVERWLESRGIRMHRTRVGDRYVHEELRSRGLRLGGEQSGHVLYLDKSPTGDGMLSALQLLAAVRASGRSLEAWMDEIPSYPQLLRNVPVSADRKRELAEHPDVAAAVAEAEAELGARGRISLRPSGTEPLVRVMVEGEDEGQVHHWSTQLVDVVTRAGAEEPQP